jgi:hypothetical protein
MCFVEGCNPSYTLENSQQGVIMFRVLVCALLGAAVMMAAPQHAARANTLAETYLLPELFDIMAEEGRKASVTALDAPQDMSAQAQWARTIARIYDADRMEADFTRALENALAPNVRNAALEFAESDLGQRIMQLEVTARRALLSDEIDEAARQALMQARDAAPDSPQAQLLARVRQRIAVNDLVELNVSLGLNTSLAYYSGMAEEGWMAGMAGSDLLALVWAQEDAIREDIVTWAEAYFLMAYQPLSDAEMTAYIAHASSPEGDAFNRAMFRAFDAVFVDISRRVGAALARQMQQDTL